MRKIWKGLAVGAAVLILAGGAWAVYVNDYYKADTEAVKAFEMAEVSVEILEDDTILCTPEEIKAGLIFYPGGKVEYTAYEPLMEACAAEGILCVLVEMPCNLAVLDSNAAEGIPEQYPEVENWYLGGHSLGGSMAAAYLEKHPEEYEGLILLGSYSTADLSETGCSVLSVYGSEDQVLNRENYEKNKGNLPTDFTELVLEGGCHAYFGMYGAQDGDGVPKITNEEQILRTAAVIGAFMEKGN